MKICAIITAGGTSSRFGNSNKLLEIINGKTIIQHTVDAFCFEKIDEVVICANSSIIPVLVQIFENYENVKIIEGGNTRQQSVFNGIKYVNCDYILIHDGARPMVSKAIIERTISMVLDKKSVSVMTKTIDTIKRVDKTGKVIQTLDRSELYNTQTPQAFEYELIRTVHEKFINENYTDDAGMVEAFGEDVYILDGDYKNIKVTTRSDLELVRQYLSKN